VAALHFETVNVGFEVQPERQRTNTKRMALKNDF